MPFFKFKSIRGIFNSLSLNGHIKQLSYRSGAPQPLHPEYGIFADLSIVPEVSDSFVEELSSLTTEGITEITEGVTNLVTGDDACLTTDGDERFVLKSIFDRQRHSRSLFPRDANDRYWEESDLRGAISHTTRSESSIPKYDASQYSESAEQSSQHSRTHLGLPRSNSDRKLDMPSHVRSSSDALADAFFFAEPGKLNLVSAQTRIVSMSSATTADLSCLIHDQEELSSEKGNRDGEDTPATRDSFRDDDATDVLPTTGNEMPGLANDNDINSDPSTLTDTESKKISADSPIIQTVPHRTQSEAIPIVRKLVPIPARKNPSTCFSPSPLAQSWEADTIETDSDNVIGSLARATAALGAQSSSHATTVSQPALRQFKPPKPPKPTSFLNFIPARGPSSGLPQHTSWQRASSFCGKRTPKALRYDSIMSKINHKVAARAKSWQAKDGQDKWWRRYLAEREEKIGKQPWDVNKNEAENQKDEDEDHENLLGTVGRRMKQEQLVHNRLHADNNSTVHSTLSTPQRQQSLSNGPYIDRLATIEANLDARLEAEVEVEAESAHSPYTRLLQENIYLKQQVAAAYAAKSVTATAAEEDRLQRLEQIRSEMNRVQRELTLLENELCDPYTDDGATAAMLNMCKLVSCHDGRSSRDDAVEQHFEDVNGVEVAQDSVHSASNTSINANNADDSGDFIPSSTTDPTSTTSTTLWPPSNSPSTTTRSTKMHLLRTHQMNLFAQEHTLRNAAPNRMTDSFSTAQETGLRARTCVPGDVWVDYDEKYTYGSCPVRMNTHGGHDDEDEVRRLRRVWYAARKGRFGVVL